MDINTLNIDDSAKLNVKAWLEGEYDEATKQAIRDMASNPQELNESFYRHLEFGTGGLRGIMGVGTNRMNRYTVAMATQGLANYVKKVCAGEKELRAAVSHDSRNHSREFAEITARVLAANGFHVYLFDGMRPTPELSFAVRHYHCHTGVMVTASHNPKEYNGYKAYWSDGCQLTAPHDTAVIDEVLKIKHVSDVRMDAPEGAIETIGEELDKVYLARVEKNSLNPEVIRRHHDVKIVYTPLHGTGITLIPRMLKQLGFTNVNIVEAQAVPDGNFPTTPSPNPEEKAAMSMAVELAKKIDADIVFASDPDADRVGVAVKRPDGEWMLLNGNQTMSVLFYYIVKQWQEKQLLTGNEYMVKTIVTSELPADIATRAGIKIYDVLTGFKFIGGKIRELEGVETFIAGGEESYGYMIGDFVRDKDAVSACSMIAEIAAWALVRLLQGRPRQRGAQRQERRRGDTADDARLPLESPSRDRRRARGVHQGLPGAGEQGPADRHGDQDRPTEEQRPAVLHRQGQQDHRAPQRHRAEDQVLLQRQGRPPVPPLLRRRQQRPRRQDRKHQKEHEAGVRHIG